MNIENVKHNGVYVLKVELSELFNGSTTVFLFVRVFQINVKEKFVEVHLVGQPRNILFPVVPESLIEAHDI